MKSIALGTLLITSTIFTYAQEKKEACKGECCSKKNTAMQENSKPIICKLTSPEMQNRKNEVIKSLKSKVRDKKELDNGYSYTFTGTDAMIDEITTFIKSERQCCDFFTFNMLVEDDLVNLSITGPEGAKDFIKTELDF